MGQPELVQDVALLFQILGLQHRVVKFSLVVSEL